MDDNTREIGKLDTTSGEPPATRGRLAKVLLWTLLVVCVLTIAITVSFVVRKTVEYDVTGTVDEAFEEPFAYAVLSATAQKGLLGFSPVTRAYVEVENADREPGTYEVRFTFTTLDAETYDTDIVYLVPGQAKTAEGVTEIPFAESWRWKYEVIPPTRKVTRPTVRTVTYEHTMPYFLWLFGLWKKAATVATAP
jgi:hypothetical protein